MVTYLNLVCASLKASPAWTISCSFLRIRSSNYSKSSHRDSYLLLCGIILLLELVFLLIKKLSELLLMKELGVLFG